MNCDVLGQPSLPNKNTYPQIKDQIVNDIKVPPIDKFLSFFLEDLFYTEKNKSTKKYIYTLQNLYTHTINIEHIIYMQESSGHPHIDQYRSKLYSLYTSNDRL